MENIFIARQPILNKDQALFGYELLFRDSMHNYANVKDDVYATCKTLINLFDNFGVDNILGNFKGFINVSEDIIMQDVINIMPKDKFVFEILETTRVCGKFIDRIKNLKNDGYIFALDDFIFTRDYLENFAPLFGYVDFIKVDIRQTSPEGEKVEKINLARGMERIKSIPTNFLAEKVETRDEYLFCRDLGFDYFQGYYFAKPAVMISKNIDPSRIVIIKLINMINKGESTSRIVDVFNVNPELSYSLLRFINSAAFFFRSEIRSISHAISLLGLKNLQNWLILLSYAGNKTQGIASPVFHAAASRAKLMELMTDKKYKSKDKRESAFLVGLLSFIDILYKRPIDELLQKLSIEKEIYNALMYFEGFYGQLLDICILENEQNFGEMTKKLENIGFSVDEFNNAKLESISWLNNLIRSL